MPSSLTICRASSAFWGGVVMPRAYSRATHDGNGAEHS
jgi:hypothetical protein